MLEYDKILRPLISNWIHDERLSEDRVYLSASSIVRKSYTLNRINNLISEHKLNLKVFESSEMEYSDRFIIPKKND